MNTLHSLSKGSKAIVALTLFLVKHEKMCTHIHSTALNLLVASPKMVCYYNTWQYRYVELLGMHHNKLEHVGLYLCEDQSAFKSLKAVQSRVPACARHRSLALATWLKLSALRLWQASLQINQKQQRFAIPLLPLAMQMLQILAIRPRKHFVSLWPSLRCLGQHFC
jgi:hypothetical protein